jgi:hypothetical protein
MNELLVILQEECAEVSKIISKIHRYGLHSLNPVTLQYNDEMLNQEIGDLLCMIDLCIEQNILDQQVIQEQKKWKREKLKEWSTLKNL